MSYEGLRGFSRQYTGLVNRLEIPVSIIKPDTSEESPICKGIIDTGATSCVISHRLANSFGLIPVGRTSILGVGGEHTANKYCIKLRLPDNYITDNLLITDGELEKQGIDFLVGMDVINQGDFAISKKNGKTLVSFITPSQETIDFVEKYSVKKIVEQKYKQEYAKRYSGHNNRKKKNKRKK